MKFYYKGRRVKRICCRTKAEAVNLDAAWRTEKTTGVRLVVDLKDSPTFCDFVEDVWLNHYRQGVEVPTWEKRIGELRNHAYSVLGDKRLAEITAGDILDFQNRLKGLRLRGKALSSTRHPPWCALRKFPPRHPVGQR